TVREVHAHRRRFAQNRIAAIGGAAVQQFRPDAQGLIRRMAHAEHPLVAAHRAHTSTHLVRQRLDSQSIIRIGERARNGVVRPFRRLRSEKYLQRLLEPTLQQMRVTPERHQPPLFHARFQRQVKSMNRIKKKQRPYAFVEVFAAVSKSLQFLTLAQQLRQGRAAAERIQRLVARRCARGCDDLNKAACHVNDLSCSSSSLVPSARKQGIEDEDEHDENLSLELFWSLVVGVWCFLDVILPASPSSRPGSTTLHPDPAPQTRGPTALPTARTSRRCHSACLSIPMPDTAHASRVGSTPSKAARPARLRQALPRATP